MRLPSFPVVALLLLAGCAQSVGVLPPSSGDAGTDATGDSGNGGDADVDATVPADAGVDTGVPPDSGSFQDAAVADAGICGDQVVGLGEQCDDGNQVDTDVCRNDCTFSPICGDGRMQGTEECDDGNNASGDGCSGQCRVERCGNGILDPLEVCDSTPGCATDCASVTGCGNGTLETSEQCDDSNTVSWDGCSSACLIERASVLSDLELMTSGGCDYTGDGLGDAQLGGALQGVLPYIAPMISQALQMSPFNVLAYQGVEDTSLLTDDPSVRIAWLLGDDANGAAADFDGTGQVRVVASTIPMGVPQLSFPGSITARVVDAGPEDVTLPFLMGADIGLSRARILATPITVTGTGTATRYSVAPMAGTLCGIAKVSGFAAIPNVLAAAAMGLPAQLRPPTTSCDTTAVPTNQVRMSDVLVGGAAIGGGFIILVYGVQPDVDVDGDGLETYTVATGTNCQAVITGCVDGDGTVIAGHGCVLDPRMQDGFSTAIHFTAPSTAIVP